MFYARNTENKSFIDMWRELQRCDVSNNIFPLNTKNKILILFIQRILFKFINDFR